VIVFSTDPRLLEQLPGYVETEPLDLTGLEDDTETFLNLNLPQGVTAVNNQRVLVQVSVAAIESNIAISLPVEAVGLTPGLASQIQPATVDVILSGPVPVLNTLKPENMRVVVDLTGLAIGTHRLAPTIEILPDRLQVVSIQPNLVDVTIFVQPTPTITPTFAPQVTPTPTRGTGAQ
jgi:YbbR domain-containing protein